MASDRIFNAEVQYVRTTNRSVEFAVIDDNERVVGRLFLMHDCGIVDEESRMGAEGKIKYPQPEQLKNRFVFDLV